KQALLEENDAGVRLRRLSEALARELEVLSIGSKIQSQVQEEMERGQREFLLRQQLKAIQEELGETDEQTAEANELREQLAEVPVVRRLKPDARGSILCFVGPPGVGKTSLGKSIARALGRKFERISAGGVRDEAEIRGHRRTYVGAMPGVIIRALRDAGSMNPLFMIDEIDKMGADFRGDPASAMLEVLDPE